MTDPTFNGHVYPVDSLSGFGYAITYTLTGLPTLTSMLVDAHVDIVAAVATTTSKEEIAIAQAVIATTQAGIATTQAGIATGAANSAPVNSCYNNIAAITTVSASIASVTTCAGNISSITACAGSISNVNTVAANLTAINTNASNITAIQNASANATTATNEATNAQNYAAAINATSTTSQEITTGSVTLTTQSSKQFAAGQWVSVTDHANVANYMHGQVTSYSGTTLIVNVTDNGGAGTPEQYDICISGSRGATGASGSLPYATAGGTVDAITVTISGLSMTDGTIIAVRSGGPNATKTPTLKLNSQAAHTITTLGNKELSNGAIGPAGFVGLYEYQGSSTKWELMNPAVGAGSSALIILSL